jgi:hypothetical protein
LRNVRHGVGGRAAQLAQALPLGSSRSGRFAPIAAVQAKRFSFRKRI